MTPHKRGFYSLSLLPATHSSRTLEGLYDSALQGPTTSPKALQGHCRYYTCEPIRCVGLGSEVSGPVKTTYTNHNCVLVRKNTFTLILEKLTE